MLHFVVYFKELGNQSRGVKDGAETLHARQRMRKQALRDESNRASNVRTLVFMKTVQGKPERQHKSSHTGQELTENV